MAISKDETPRLLYYSLFHTDDAGRPQSSLQQMILDHPPEALWMKVMSGGKFVWYSNYRLQSAPPSECSWIRANRFSYFWNTGLRAACRESRAELLRRLDTVNQSTRSLSESQRRIRRITCFGMVYPGADIVCLRFSPQDMAAGFSLRWDALLTHLPFFSLPRDSYLNLAMDFDESWADGLNRPGPPPDIDAMLHEASPRGVAMRAYWAWLGSEIPRDAHMYLIDRSGRLPAYCPLQDTSFYSQHDAHEAAIFRYNRTRAVNLGNRFFFDGAKKYAACYTHHQVWDFPLELYNEVPVLCFIAKTRRYCKYPKLHSQYWPDPDQEDFFRVLRPVPDCDKTC